jgi:predicted PurR-regulated permease PerM
MTMLREEAPSVLAVLDAFVHDPLMDWFVKVRHIWAAVFSLTCMARGLQPLFV